VVTRRTVAAVAAAALTAAGCVAHAAAREHAGRRTAQQGIVLRSRDVRVALATAAPTATVAASGRWTMLDAEGHALVRGSPRDHFTVERDDGKLRLTRGEAASAWSDGPLTLQADEASGALVSWDGKRYRGELVFFSGDSGILVVNRVPLETYLRGVVPLEIGNDRTVREHAAVEAQAIAARSYTLVRMNENAARRYDLLGSVTDQLYGGVSAERAVSDAAIEATAGMVLTFEGRPVSAPYSSTCGGTTAVPPELWRTGSAGFLRQVSDRIPDTDRYYCDIAPRFRWTRSFDAGELAAVLDRYLRRYASVPTGALGALRAITVDDHTPSGRVASVSVATDRGTYRVRGNDMRYVLRSPGGDLLNSTYFSLAPVVDRGGHLVQLTVRGSGYGHGVGMCQWGAIGRARAGQDFRTILQTYYPGTSIARVD
jgi:stage II sporulation protein D (peptidoglycan lytic transglycosylase)